MSFEEFAIRWTPTLLRTAVLLTADRGHAEDLVQVALWRTARRWDRAQRAPEAYSRRVLINLSRDRTRGLKHRASEVELDRLRGGVEDPVRLRDDRDALVRAVQALPRRQREVIALRFILDLSVADAAASLGCSEGTVKSYTARALASLRASLTTSLEVPNVDR